MGFRGVFVRFRARAVGFHSRVSLYRMGDEKQTKSSW